MSIYEDRFFSLVRFCKECAEAISVELEIPVPLFVNLDAHANYSTLPNGDIIGLRGYSIVMDDKLPTVFVGFCVSTQNDPDLVRHMKMIGHLFAKLQPEDTIPVFRSSAPTQQNGFMVVSNGTTLEPCDKTELRSFQMINTQLLSGAAEED